MKTLLAALSRPRTVRVAAVLHQRWRARLEREEERYNSNFITIGNDK